MIIGVPQEVKNNEFRVGLTPGNVSGLCKQGHSVLLQFDRHRFMTGRSEFPVHECCGVGGGNWNY